MKSRWTGSVYLSERFLGYVGPVDRTALHSHHAIQIGLGLEGRFRLRDGKGRSHSGRAAVVPCDLAHAIVEAAGRVLLLYVNPDDVAGRRISRLAIAENAHAWFTAGRPLARLTFPLTAHSSEEFERAVRVVTQRLVGEATRPAVIHPAVRRVLAALPFRLEGDVRLASLAREVGLSPGRLGHVFSETVGIPLRPYVLWLRLKRAGAEVRAGSSLTTAAHAAGFTDAAHLSNTFRRMFGLSPSQVSSSVRFINPARRLTG